MSICVYLFILSAFVATAKVEGATAKVEDCDVRPCVIVSSEGFTEDEGGRQCLWCRGGRDERMDSELFTLAAFAEAFLLRSSLYLSISLPHTNLSYVASAFSINSLPSFRRSSLHF